jgi:proline iminopeptidase
MINFVRNTSTSKPMEHKKSKYYQTIYTHSFMLFIVMFLLIFTGCSPVEKKANPFLKAKNGYIKVEGGKIWYGIMGEGDNTPLLYLHGGPGGKSNYNLSEIADNRPVIIFDQLGNGRSDHHKDTSLLKVDKLVEQVRAVKTTLNLNEFYLSGGSWGTALALEYYNKYPEGIKGLLFNSPYFSTKIWTDDADILIAALPDSIQSAIRTAEADSIFNTASYDNANKFFAKKHGRRTEKKSHPFDTIAYKSDPFIYNYMWGPSEFTSTGTLRNYDIHQTLKDIKVPVLFTTGEFDEARPETVKKLSALVPGSNMVVIEGAGHSTSNDNLPALISAMKNFLNNQKK